MGTHFAPVYATLVIGYLEEELLYSKILDKYGNDFKEYFIKNWKRFLDDIFIIWPKSKDELNNFNKLLNNLHTDLKFTMENSTSDMPFLDILVKLQGTKSKLIFATNLQIANNIYYLIHVILNTQNKTYHFL